MEIGNWTIEHDRRDDIYLVYWKWDTEVKPAPYKIFDSEIQAVRFCEENIIEE